MAVGTCLFSTAQTWEPMTSILLSLRCTSSNTATATRNNQQHFATAFLCYLVLHYRATMWSKQIRSVFAISALSTVIWICWYGLKMKLAGDLSNDENTLPADRRGREFVDPKSVSLRATATATSAVIDLQTDASQQARVSYVTSFWAQESESGSEVHPH